MSALAATQIPKPADEQAFERASVILWKGLLGDPNVQRNGRRGQRQNGVDLFGVRNGDPAYYVGIQCKLKSDGNFLTETEVRDEVKKALTFKPELREYFITATSPDDVVLQELARELSVELKKKGRNLLIYVWGWNTLEERISNDAVARKQFDPDYGAFSEQILKQVGQVAVIQEEIQEGINTGFAHIDARLARFEMQQIGPGDDTKNATALEAQIDAEIDEYRDLAIGGKPRVAHPLLERLLNRVKDTASGRILFRIKANIGICLLNLQEDERAAVLLLEAYDHAPTEPKAIANKAFSLLLQGRWQELLSFGIAALKTDPTNEGLAGYIVQAAKFDLSIDNPLDLIPDDLKTSASVMIAYVDFLRRRQARPQWWEAAHTAAQTHPADLQATRFAAEADLEQIASSDHFQRTQLLEPEERKRLQASIDVLVAQWEKARVSDGLLRPENAALCSNAMMALHIMGDVAKALEIGNQGLTLGPNDLDIISRLGVIAFESYDNELAEKMLNKLPPGPQATVLGFRLYASTNNWAELNKLLNTQSEHVPESERAIITVAGKLAAIKLTPGNDTETHIAEIALEAKNSARASIFVARFAQKEGFENVANTAYEAARLCIHENSHIASRITVATYAAWQDDWDVAADLLNGYIAEDHDSDELRTLARSFVNDHPIRERALRFFNRLPETVRNQPYFLYMQGALHLNRGDLASAEAALKQAVDVQPNLQNYLALFSLLHRSERGEEIKELVANIDPSTIEGSPREKIRLAQILQISGDGPRAIEFAYNVLQSAKNNSDVALGYFGLTIFNPNDGLIPDTNAVGINTWVRLEDNFGEGLAFIIEEGEDRVAEQIYKPTHPIAALALGLTVGDRFSIQSPLGHEREWRVIEIKHKYLHALHDVMNNFETRFPEAKGFYKFTVRDGDVQPILDQVRLKSENDRKFADLYLVNHLPLNMVASHVRANTVGFAEYIRSLNFSIETCVGTEPERVAARDVIKTSRSNGAVLDTYTAWTVASMDAFDPLKAVFGTLVIPQSVIDELRDLRDRYGPLKEPSMTLAWRNGEYIKEEHTVEDVAQRRDQIAGLIAKIESACTVKPATAPDKLPEAARRLTDLFDSHVLDAAYLATEGYVLISEDQYYRQIAEVFVSIKSVWLQAAFAFAHETKLFESTNTYADLIIKLALRRHSYVSFDADILFIGFEHDDTEDLQLFRALVNSLGTENAEMSSHIKVATRVLGRIWSEHSDLKAMKATGILLERMIKHRGAAWALTLALLKVQAASNEFRSYVDEWIKGHFLSIAAVDAAVRQVNTEIERRLSR